MYYNKKNVLVRSPLRISFLGGGTDLESYYKHHPGHVVNATIDSYVYINLKDMFDSNIRIHHSKIETESISSRITHEYMKQALEYFGLFKGVEVIMTSDIMTTGSGLGASSAAMGALVLAAASLRGQKIDNDKYSFAELIYNLEHKAGTVGGKQDQYASVFGGINSIEFSEKNIKVNNIKLTEDEINEFSDHLLLVFTNLARNSQPIQENLKNNIKKKNKHQHLEKLYEISLEFKKEIKSGELNYHQLGKMLHENWELKKEINPYSTNRYIDELYDYVRNNGVIGGKITGAGGGGFLLAITKDRDSKQKLMNDLYPNYICLDVKIVKKGTELLWKNF